MPTEALSKKEESTESGEEKTYQKEEAHQLALDFYGGDDLAASTFLNKYALTNKDKQ